MAKTRLLLFILGASIFFLPIAGTQQKATSSTSGAASQSKKQSPGSSSGFNVCEGTFALCTEAACEPAGANGEITAFKCECKVQAGYSLGFNGPKNRASCQSVPKEPPSAGQKIPSRYSPIKNFVACTNNRPWADCLNAPCTVHAGPNDPQKYAATCSCPKVTGGPYLYVPHNGQYSRSGCQDQYISSAPLTNFIQVTQFLTTPAGKDLPALPVTILVPTPSPTPPH